MPDVSIQEVASRRVNLEEDHDTLESPRRQPRIYTGRNHGLVAAALVVHSSPSREDWSQPY